jgi:hypothetical protein
MSTEGPPGRTLTHRSTALYRFRCHAEPGYFLPWAEVPEALQDELDVNGGLPCEGGGVPGLWCQDCRFGSSEELTVIEHRKSLL